MGQPAASNEDFVREHDAWARGIARAVARDLRLLHELDDLVAYAFEGLLDARARWDHERPGGVPFQGFAYYRVRGAVLDGAYRVRGMTRRALVNAMQALDGRIEEVGERRPMVPPEARAEDAATQLAGILNAIADSEALAMIADDERSGEARVIAELDRERVRRAIERLPERERIVLLGVYYDEAPLDDIGAKLGLTRSGTSRLHTRAVALLRETLD